MCASTDGRAGTISEPVAVETSTSRRQRARWNMAKCCATAPPQEMPSTSTWP
jgi:hypothetical protein